MNPPANGQGEKYIVEKNMIDINDLSLVANEPMPPTPKDKKDEAAV